MLINHFKIALRALRHNKAHAAINIAGLSMGMTVALLIGLWIWDELSFNHYHPQYDRIAQVMLNTTANGNVRTSEVVALPMEAELRKSYGSDFKHIVMTAWTEQHTVSVNDKKLSSTGNFMGAEAPDMLSLHMLKGSRSGLTGPAGMMIAQSLATALFGEEDPMDKTITLDNKATFNVSGVYEDLPGNTSFHELAFIAPWDFFVSNPDWLQRNPADWSDNSLFLYVQAADNADMVKLSAKIKDIMVAKVAPAQAKQQPEIFLHPMSKWHLYSEFKNGINTGGAIQYVWLFGIIGFFVLLLACINFMNLSTARSEKRAKEVGVRKAIGSLRTQLIGQFFTESLLMALLAFGIALFLTAIALPFFNQVANKEMNVLWSNPRFWLINASFVAFTGLIAGSYPAFYLSSFKPVKVLKGTFKAGRLAAIPRKALVVVQFTVSVVLIIGTIVVYKQIQFAKNRPVGYSREGLVDITTLTPDLHQHFEALRTDLLKAGAITEIAAASMPTTAVNYTRSDVEWKGKDPNKTANFANVAITSTYGKTVGWQFVQGRDFLTGSRADSLGLVLNEASVQLMGLENPLGETVKVGKRYLTVIGVVKDMVMGSPYAPAKPGVFFLGGNHFDEVLLKINPRISAHAAIATIEAACKAYAPAIPFTYRFADDEYNKKFSNEERIGKLATVFSILAIFISCLGLFGMASFMAEQRVKEIGVRKVLGASVVNLWALLSKDFVALVLVALFIAIPLAYYCMDSWLQNYRYRAELSWWVFAATAVGALLITIVTVSYQSIRAALSNPVRSLRSE
jgi:putative ABC transport system permease protein